MQTEPGLVGENRLFFKETTNFLKNQTVSVTVIFCCLPPFFLTVIYHLNISLILGNNSYETVVPTGEPMVGSSESGTNPLTSSKNGHVIITMVVVKESSLQISMGRQSRRRS